MASIDRATGTADQADLIKFVSGQLNPMSLHSTLVWQLPAIERQIDRNGGRSWEGQRSLDKQNDDDDDDDGDELFTT